MYFFKSRCGRYQYYMGKDKFENEHLIKWGWPEDLWFHVDGLSSAHVYLRMPSDMTWDNVPKEVIDECAQLCKANSIEGCKLARAKIVYTPWLNLKKTAGMEDGQVGFHREQDRKYVTVEKDRLILNELNRGKEEAAPDLEQARLQRDRAERDRARLETARKQKSDLEEQQRQQAAKELRGYKGFFDGASAVLTNRDMSGMTVEEIEEGFM